MTYDQAIDFILSLNISDKTLEKALKYIEFVKQTNPYKIKLTPNEARRLEEILESK